MVCFIRDLATWAHIAQCKVTDYDVPVYSSEDSVGKIKIVGEHPEYKRCWVILDGHIFYGETASPDNGSTELTVSRPMNAFDRTLEYKQNLIYEVTEDSSMNSEKRYFEKVSNTSYIRTSDIQRNPSKIYYVRGDDGWYICVNISAFQYGVTYYHKTEDATYYQTSDREMIPTKRYYVEVEGEEDLVVTTDTEFVYGTTYYEKVEDAQYDQTEDATYNAEHEYYVQNAKGKYAKVNGTIFDEDVVFYEAVAGTKYIVTGDSSFQSGKTYYELTDRYGGNGTEVLETYIKRLIEESFINESDQMYAMPYITVYATGETPVELSYMVNEVFSFLDIIDLAYEKQIIFNFVVSASGISIYISNASSSVNNIFFDDGHNFLEDVTISDEIVARVTVRRINSYEDGITVEEERDFYWHLGGNIETTPPNPRIKGIWDIVSVNDEDVDLITAAEESMAGNSEATKVTFYSDKFYNLWDVIACPINNEVVVETITSCSINFNDPRYLYTLGRMPTTLTEKFEQSAYDKNNKSARHGSAYHKSANRSSQSVTYEEQSDSYLSQVGGIINGSVNVQNTMTADKMVVGSSSYGSTLPEAGTVGQVYFVI